MLSLRLALVSAIVTFAIGCGSSYFVAVYFTVTDAITHADARRTVIVRRDS